MYLELVEVTERDHRVFLQKGLCSLLGSDVDGRGADLLADPGGDALAAATWPIRLSG